MLGKNFALVGDYFDFSKVRFSDKMDPNHTNVLNQKWPDVIIKKAWLAADKEK